MQKKVIISCTEKEYNNIHRLTQSEAIMDIGFDGTNIVKGRSGRDSVILKTPEIKSGSTIINYTILPKEYEEK